MKAILFDLDETMILDELVTEDAFLAAAKLAAPTGADVPRLAHAARDAAVRLWRAGPCWDFCDRIGHSAAEGLWARYNGGSHPAVSDLWQWAPTYRQSVWQEALAQQGIADQDLAVSQVDRFMAARRRYPRYPEIDDLLTELRARGYLLGVVTNGVPDLQREKLARCEVAGLFHATVVSGEIDCGKPDPGIFRHICSELGVGPEECVMVGDNPGRDVAGATNAGMRSVWVQRNGRPRDERYPATLECTDLTAMLPWLDRL